VRDAAAGMRTKRLPWNCGCGARPTKLFMILSVELRRRRMWATCVQGVSVGVLSDDHRRRRWSHMLAAAVCLHGSSLQWLQFSPFSSLISRGERRFYNA